MLLQHARAAAEIGAKGLIVHGGHVDKGGELDVGFDNWRKTFAYAAKEGGFGLPILIENTAGGDNACARRFDALSRLWDAVGDFGAGFCLDTCHAHAGGEELLGIVDRVKAITGGSTSCTPTTRVTRSTLALTATTISARATSTRISSSRSSARPARRPLSRRHPTARPADIRLLKDALAG